MAFTFINDPTNLNSNSYCSVSRADDYHETVHPTQRTAWNALSTENKQRALVAATRMIDNQFVWIEPSYIASTDQILQFPRKDLLKQGRNGYAVTFNTGLPESTVNGTGYFSSTEYPAFLQDATAELARDLFSKTVDPTQVKSDDKLSKVKTGSVEISYKDQPKSISDGPVSPQVVDMLNRWADITRPALAQTGSGLRVVPLLRG